MKAQDIVVGQEYVGASWPIASRRVMAVKLKVPFGRRSWGSDKVRYGTLVRFETDGKNSWDHANGEELIVSNRNLLRVWTDEDQAAVERWLGTSERVARVDVLIRELGLDEQIHIRGTSMVVDIGCALELLEHLQASREWSYEKVTT